MAKNSQKYWEQRARQNKLKVIATGERGINELKRLLKTNLDDVQGKIKQFYEKYGDRAEEFMTPAELKKYKAELAKGLKKFPKDKTIKKIAKDDIPKYKIDRLRALETDLQLTLSEATKGQELGIYKTLDDVSKVSQAVLVSSFEGADIEFNRLSTRRLKALLSSDWSGKNWSERLWKDRELVGEKLTEVLEKGIAQGTSLQRMSRELSKLTGEQFNNSFRLIRTESAFIDNSILLERFKQAKDKLGYTEYIYDAFLDNRTSKICKELDGKRFKIDDAEVGVNFPPMHPNCRSTAQLAEDSINDDDLDFWAEGKNPDPYRKNVDKFVDNILDESLESKINSIKVGEISNNVKKFLKKQNIDLGETDINLTYRKVKHALRDNKNPNQKVTVSQLKRLGGAVKENEVYFDTVKNNLVYVLKLPPDEVIDGRDIIKIPVNIYKGNNDVATASRVDLKTISNDKRYKKID